LPCLPWPLSVSDFDAIDAGIRSVRKRVHQPGFQVLASSSLTKISNDVEQ
jgi:hypothetical protein